MYPKPKTLFETAWSKNNEKTEKNDENPLSGRKQYHFGYRLHEHFKE